MDEATKLQEKMVAMNEALLLGSLRQHELTETAEKLNRQLRTEITERKQAEDALRESEERYRTLFNSIDEGFCIIEKTQGDVGQPIDFLYVEANQAFEAQSGMRDIVGKTIRQMLPDEPEGWCLIYDTILKTGEPLRFERGLVTRGRVLELYAFRVADETHRRVAVIFKDITARKHTEEALRTSEERYRTLFNSIDEGFCVIESIFDEHDKPIDYRYLEINPTFTKQTGLREAVGKRMRDLVPDIEEHWIEIYGKVALTGEPIRFVNEAKAMDGRWFDVYACRVGQSKDRKVAIVFNDITTRREAEEDLSEKARLLDLSNDAIIVHDLDEKICSWNMGAERLYGWTAEEVIGQRLAALLKMEFPKPMEEIRAQLQSEGHFSGELIQTARNGRRVVALCRWVLDLGTKSILTSYTDITERKLNDEVVRVAAERFRFLAESMPQKICTAGPDGEIDYFNQQWLEFTGMTLERLKELGWKEFIHPDDLEENIRRWRHSIETGENLELEHRFRRHDGAYRWHITRAYALRDAAGKITMWIGSNTDINDMMLAQEELVQAKERLSVLNSQLEDLVHERTAKLRVANEQLLSEAEERKRLEADIARAIEGEQSRLGGELHDGLLQDLTGIAIKLFVLEKMLLKASSPLASEAHHLLLLLEDAHGSARDLAKSFYPVELEQLGLPVAIQGLAQRIYEQKGVSCVAQIEAKASAELKNNRATQLYRIVQEALQNAVKHSQAKEILIRLWKQDDAWMLTVKDDGVGLQKEALQAGGMGLRIMEYRARVINGTLTVRNFNGGGVIVSCTVPATG